MRKLGSIPSSSNPANNGGGARVARSAFRPASDPCRSAANRRVARAIYLDCVRLANASWLVTGGAQPHRVSPDARTCNCLDHQHHGGSCKHIVRCKLAEGDARTLEALRALVQRPKRQRRPKVTP